MNILNIDELRRNCKKIHAFGLGFIQLKLSDTDRLHFYVPEVTTTVDVEDIHNHRYWFLSKILKGELTQEIYTIKEGPGNYILRDESCSTERNPSIKMPTTCHPELLLSMVHRAGSDYMIEANTFHRVSAYRCITQVSRPEHRDVASFINGFAAQAFFPYKEYAQVVSKIGSKSSCPFSRNFSQKLLWEIVEREINEPY